MPDDDFLTVIPDDEIEEENEPSKTYYLDFEHGRILGNIDGREAMQQAILKALITPRFKCMIYTDQYGSEIKEDMMAGNASDAYFTTVIPDYIKDALLPDERVLDVGDISVIIQDDSAHISLTVQTIFGDIDIEEVI